MFPVTKIQQFCTKDGPGIRTTVFFKGCPLHCVWCHNPETQSNAPAFFYAENLCLHCGTCKTICPKQVHHVTDTEHTLIRTACNHCMQCVDSCPTGALETVFRWLTAEEIFQRVLKDKAFYGECGGVTFSGGEPTVHTGKLIPLLRRLQEIGIHTAIETCGYFDSEILPTLVAATDLFLWDIKDTDERRHIEGTGVSNRKILYNLQAADALGAKTVLRCLLRKSVNLNLPHLQAIASLYQSLKHCIGVELIPYHTYGVSKNIQLGQNVIPHQEWIPSAEDIRKAENFLKNDVPVIHNS